MPFAQGRGVPTLSGQGDHFAKRKGTGASAPAPLSPRPRGGHFAARSCACSLYLLVVPTSPHRRRSTNPGYACRARRRLARQRRNPIIRAGQIQLLTFSKDENAEWDTSFQICVPGFRAAFRRRGAEQGGVGDGGAPRTARSERAESDLVSRPSGRAREGCPETGEAILDRSLGGGWNSTSSRGWAGRGC